MKITNTQLKRIIKEELENVMNEMEMGGEQATMLSDEELGSLIRNPEAADTTFLMSKGASRDQIIDLWTREIIDIPDWRQTGAPEDISGYSFYANQ